MSDEHPLRGVVQCPTCNRKYTSWITKKYKVKNGERTMKEYPYYGCQNNTCQQRINVPKAKLESDFDDLLKQLKIP